MIGELKKKVTTMEKMRLKGVWRGGSKTKLEEVYRSVQHPNRTIAVLFGDITTKAVAALPGPNRARERPRATNNSSWCIYGRGQDNTCCGKTNIGEWEILLNITNEFEFCGKGLGETVKIVHHFMSMRST
ncbi:hypothetical protein GBAR_LOCUS11577 [Geodia barretti]|nr:hypothetical protein GBAR_LOCUS11577 [Geodia barretti]